MTDAEQGGMLQLAGALTSPICKLIEVVSKGVGQLYLPIHIERMAVAESRAENIKRLSIIDLPSHELRALHRLILTETRRQVNIERIFEGARKQLPATVSESPVDEDWIREFFNCCQDCSDDRMQGLWSCLLRDEVDRPGSFSRRTLNALRLLTSEEALAFRRFSARVCQFIDDSNNQIGALISGLAGPTPGAPDEAVTTRDIALIAGAGLVSAGEVLAISRSGPWTLRYGAKSYRLRAAGNDVEIEVHRLTPIGEELYPIALPGTTDDFEMLLRPHCIQRGLEADSLLSTDQEEMISKAIG